VEEDPRLEISVADRRAHLETIQRLSQLIAAMDQGHKRASDIKNQVRSLQKSLKQAGQTPKPITSTVNDFAKKIDDLEKKLSQSGGLGRIRYPQQRPLFS
jgi:septal ring factor EnvC (AmiA/AmiB activator)